MKRYIVKNDLAYVRYKVYGLAPEELAKMSGVRKEAIVEIEKNEREPSLVTAILLAKALHCHVEELFYIEKVKRKKKYK